MWLLCIKIIFEKSGKKAITLEWQKAPCERCKNLLSGFSLFGRKMPYSYSVYVADGEMLQH